MSVHCVGIFIVYEVIVHILKKRVIKKEAYYDGQLMSMFRSVVSRKHTRNRHMAKSKTR